MNGSLLLLPLDDRPVNLDFPPQLARIAGETLLTPPKELLGRFLTPGHPAELGAWLAHHAPDARALILSLDMLAYGGLVASRTPTVTAEEALARLQVLREIKAAHPALRIFAFNVIMRLTITGADAETRAAGRDIFRYSVLRDQVERLGDTAAATELMQVEARIPPRLLTAYLGARARNHAVNCAAIELLADGVIDFLALVQEDTAPAGLHIPEQQALQALAHARVDGARWRLYPGTDEAAMTLLARYLLQESGTPFPVAISLRDPVAAQSPALYEDLPLAEAARRHLDAVGGQLRASGLPFAVHTFIPPQQDLFDLPSLPAPTWAAALGAFPHAPVESWLASLGGGRMALADVAYCNGGDPQLLHALLTRGQYMELTGYAGWNTAGNTLGTVYAHAALHAVGRAKGFTPAMERAHYAALMIRLLDDGVYQPIIRAWIGHRAEENGLSPLNLSLDAARVDIWVNSAMQQCWTDMRERYPCLAACDRPFTATLPWGRVFEVRIALPD